MGMSVKKLDKYLGISLNSIQRATLHGDMPYHRIGRRMFFELDEFLMTTKEKRPPIR